MHIGVEAEALIELGAAAALILASIRYLTRGSRRAAADSSADEVRPRTVNGTTFGVLEDGLDYRSPDMARTVFIGANDLAPHFSVERKSALEGLHPFARRVQSPPEFAELEFRSDEPAVLEEALSRAAFRQSLLRAFAPPQVRYVISIAASDRRRMVFKFPRYTGPESGVLLLMRYTPKKAPADPAEDVERLLELAPNMRSSDYSAARAPIPSLPHLLASGVWNTFKLFLIVGAGLIALLALFYLIARLA